MLRLYRIYRLSKLVSRKITKESTDPFLVGLNPGMVRSVTVRSCLESFKVIARHPEFAARQVFDSAIDRGYIVIHYSRYVKLTEKGEDLIEGYGLGLARAIVAKEWKFITLLLPIATFVIGQYWRRS